MRVMLRTARSYAVAIPIILGLGVPSTAFAFTDQVVHLQGVKILATRSSGGNCGVDFVISAADGDRHLVMIDYSYHGTFSYIPGNFTQLTTTTRSDVINVHVGRMTYSGNVTRVPATALGLVCGYSWDFNFIAREYNGSQAERDQEEARKKKEEERAAEIRKPQEEALANKRRSQEMQREIQSMNEKARRDRLEAYRRASPENARCLIGEPADIAKCEQWKAVERARQMQQDAAMARSREIDASARVVDQSRVDAVGRAKQDMTNNNCSFSAGLPTRIPYPTVNTNNTQYQAEIKRIDALNWDIQQKFHNEVKAASDSCDASRARTGNAALQNQMQQQEESARVQIVQQQQYEARQKALIDVEIQAQRGQQTVNEAIDNTRGMQNNNANLLDMINRLK